MLVLPIVLLTACVDSLDDYNIDQKKASAIPPRTLFSNALKNLTDALTTPNVNNNNYRMFVQHWTTTTYLDEPRYSMTSRTYSLALWNAIYRDVLADLKEAKRLIDLDATLDPVVKNNQLGLIGILEVYSWDVLVKTFGSVPYSKALDSENLLPDYDDADVIYGDLLTRLDAALGLLATGSSFGTADLIYNGSVDKWRRFGNSLKMKMGLTIADQNNGKAKTTVEAAAAAGVLGSNDDRARFPYAAATPNNNPVSANTNPIFTSREDFVVASTIVDVMNTLNDPRRPFYFTTIGSAYVGGVYGFPNTYANFSKPSAKITDPTFEGLLMDYAEVEFMLAEAVERGYTVTGTAQSHYNAAVTASITYWGGTAADATAYLAQTGVDYANAASGATYKEKIGKQKWIALNNRGWEAWVEWRRLDFPALTPPLATLKIPVRMIYPPTEGTSNTAPYESAVAKLPGGVDSPDVKLFWDKF